MNAFVTHLFTFAAIATFSASTMSLDAQDTTTLDRTKAPELSPPKPVTLPPAMERTLANGLKLVVVERRQLPIVDFVLVVPGGAAENPESRAGMADLMAKMLTAGTKTRTSLQIDDEAAFLGVDLSANSSWDATRVSLTTPTDKLDSALTLMADVVLNPSFPRDEFTRIKQERRTALLQLKDHGSAIADRAFQNLVFGDEHPYGRPASGDEESVWQMPLGDIQKFYKTYFAPNTSTLIAVGDITLDQLEAKANKLFGAWERRTVTYAKIPQAKPIAATTIYVVNKPDAAQSSFRIGTVGVARSTPDYFPLEVMNTILGASFTSRLNMNLRETKGYTYGAGSRFDMRRDAGPFTARSEIVAAMTDSALIEFMKELRGIRDTVPVPELTKAKNFLELQLPGNFETTRDIANQLSTLVLYGLPLDYYNSYSAKISAVTQADVADVANRYIDPAKLTILIVGDLKSIEPKLEALNMGPVRIRPLGGSPHHDH